jgi:hypothetical protein
MKASFLALPALYIALFSEKGRESLGVDGREARAAPEAADKHEADDEDDTG